MPSSASQARRATSWVLPSDGVASVLPIRSSAESMSCATTSEAPPDVVPATRVTSPPDSANALMAGLGPMNVASMDSESRASLASVPELNVKVSRLASPRFSAKIPSSTPMMAGAWVTLGK